MSDAKGQALAAAEQAPAVRHGAEQVIVRLANTTRYDPKLGDDVIEWVAEARWFPAHLTTNVAGGRRTRTSSKAVATGTTAAEALERITNLLVTQWPAIEAELIGGTIASL